MSQDQMLSLPETGRSGWPHALCCGSVEGHKEIGTHWDPHLNAFLTWLAHNGRLQPSQAQTPGLDFIIRVTTSINSGRECGIMEYGALTATDGAQLPYRFMRVETNSGRLQGHIHRRAFKNYKCNQHGLFYQLDLYTP